MEPKKINKFNDFDRLRDLNIKGQLEAFIAFFENPTIDIINEYQVMCKTPDNNMFIDYLNTTLNHIFHNGKNNEVYGHLLDDYLNTVNKVIIMKAEDNYPRTI